jgi:hypothetical protein
MRAGEPKYKNGFSIYNPSHKRLYHIWFDMRRRCHQPQNKRYSRYGGRGIRVCEEWDKDFQPFYDWAMANGYSDALTIDRIDRDGDYCPENCRWADIITQANNRSNNHYIEYQGQTKTLMEWSKILNMSYTTLRKRLRDGWSIAEAFETPIGGGRNDKRQ